MTHRYFSALPIVNEHAVIDGPEAHHMLHVMRAKVGDEVTLFDNSGDEFEALIQQVHRSKVELTIQQRSSVDRELARKLRLAVTLPKGDRQKWLVEKIVELGVTELIPIRTRRSVAQPSDSSIERLSRVVIEAAKQCGRNRLMEIRPAVDIKQFLVACAESEYGCRFICHPSDNGCGVFELADGEDVAALVGPEGGFTEEEVSLALTSGWTPVELGPRILRIETAAIAIASLVALKDKRQNIE